MLVIEARGLEPPAPWRRLYGAVVFARPAAAPRGVSPWGVGLQALSMGRLGGPLGPWVSSWLV